MRDPSLLLPPKVARGLRRRELGGKRERRREGERISSLMMDF